MVDLKIVKKHIYIILLLLSNSLFAQIDSLKLKNGDELVGEIKSLDKGVLIMETDYSDSDFKIEWVKISQINTQSHFLISMQDGSRYYSTLKSYSDSRVLIIKSLFEVDTFDIKHVVYLNAFENRFLDRLSASIDIGFDLTKARNLATLTSTSKIGYKAEKWLLDASFSSLWSTQDETENIVRNEGDINYRFIFPKGWYSIATISLLSNTEQELDLRSNIQLGFGRFLVQKNTAYWGVKLGLNRNIENYTAAETDSTIHNRDSWEGYLGSEIDLYDIGDLKLTLSTMLYPSITEKGRLRSDSNFNLKYDLPFDFYIRLGGSVNYDNQPGSDISKWDYVLQTGFGWEL